MVKSTGLYIVLVILVAAMAVANGKYGDERDRARIEADIYRRQLIEVLSVSDPSNASIRGLDIPRDAGQVTYFRLKTNDLSLGVDPKSIMIGVKTSGAEPIVYFGIDDAGTLFRRVQNPADPGFVWQRLEIGTGGRWADFKVALPEKTMDQSNNHL